jgi:transcriptional regulator with XRE-family HTH domain
LNLTTQLRHYRVVSYREQLRGLRQSLGIPQTKLCTDLGIDRTCYSLWENGNGKLRDATVNAVALYLETAARTKIRELNEVSFSRGKELETLTGVPHV